MTTPTPLANLIPADAIESQDPVVNLRDVHAYLEVDTQYPVWAKRKVAQNNFVEDEDYLVFRDIPIPVGGVQPCTPPAVIPEQKVSTHPVGAV